MKQSTSRRRFIQTALGGIAALLIKPTLALADEKSSTSLATDVCVIGAGFSGLCAALTLKKAGKSVVLLEARNRVGGRVLSIPLKDGGWVDEGGQWLGPTQDRFYAYVNETNSKTYPSPIAGKSVVYGIFEQKYFRVDDWDGVSGMDLVKKTKSTLQAMADSLNPEAPWMSPHAELWDSITLAQWIREHTKNENAYRYLANDMSYACANPEEISLLSFLSIIRACFSFKNLDNFLGGAQQDRVIGGAQSVALKLAEMLQKEVRLQQAVRKIEWNNSGATVKTDSLEVNAKHVIFAAPPTLIGAVEYEPGLPTRRANVTMHWPQGLVIKISMVYDKPWWRDEGLSGISLDYSSFVSETADSSPAPEYSKSGVLTGFVYANKARIFSQMSPSERKKLALEEMATRFGKEALTPYKYTEMSWSTQSWTRGCYGGYLAPGATWLAKSAVRDPVGPLHWAGTETSTVWPTFIEGAIRSGERAAEEVLKSMS